MTFRHRYHIPNLLSLIAVLMLTSALGANGQSAVSVEIIQDEEGRGQLLLNGESRVIKGIHYSPWRAGTGPGKQFPYPDEEALREDLELIRSAGANAILVYDPPQRLVALADKYELFVVCTFHIEWWKLPAGQIDELAADVRKRASALRAEPNIIAWMLGNEVDGWVLDEIKPEGVRESLGTLRDAVRSVDTSRPVCYGNLVLHRTMGLDDEMDLVAYNIYPFYPTEVPAMGYERFIRQEIMPLADGRPVLITEFGLNTLEASEERQAEVLRDCWNGLLEAGCQGGMVFAFADEWWKNYNNPIIEPDWWRREPAPDDHLRHDRDPEEYYGIVRADRSTKLAYETVQSLFGGNGMVFKPKDAPELESERRMKHIFWLLGALGIVAVAGAALYMSMFGHTSSQESEEED